MYKNTINAIIMKFHINNLRSNTIFTRINGARKKISSFITENYQKLIVKKQKEEFFAL